MAVLAHLFQKMVTVPPLVLLFLVLGISNNHYYYANGLSTVVYGPQSRELLLLTAKLAAKEGIETSFICAPDTEIGCSRLMYGVDYANQLKEQQENNNQGNANVNDDSNNKARPISSGDAIQEALTNANSLVLITYDNPIEEKTINTLLGATKEENLKRVVLLSRMGVSKASSGFFGGGGDAKLLQSEKVIRDACRRLREQGSGNDSSSGSYNDLELSIVRAGHILKGGGPGKEGMDYGLDKSYYNTLFDVVEASVTMAHDKYTLGALCTAGDTIETPNMITKMSTKSSFEPQPFESNRIIAASAVVAAILHEKAPLEFSISTQKGETPPSRQEWEEMLNQL